MSTTLERPALDTPRKVPTAKDTGTLLKGQKRTGWALLAPALLHSAIFIVIPVVAVLVLSAARAQRATKASTGSTPGEGAGLMEIEELRRHP